MKISRMIDNGRTVLPGDYIGGHYDHYGNKCAAIHLGQSIPAVAASPDSQPRSECPTTVLVPNSRSPYAAARPTPTSTR
jgi:hypothetical protein